MSRISEELSLPFEVVDAAGCARLLKMSTSSFNHLAAERAWLRGELPTPFVVGRGSGKPDRHGRLVGMRRWLVRDIEAWIVSHLDNRCAG